MNTNQKLLIYLGIIGTIIGIISSIFGLIYMITGTYIFSNDALAIIWCICFALGLIGLVLHIQSLIRLLLILIPGFYAIVYIVFALSPNPETILVVSIANFLLILIYLVLIPKDKLFILIIILGFVHLFFIASLEPFTYYLVVYTVSLIRNGLFIWIFIRSFSNKQYNIL